MQVINQLAQLETLFKKPQQLVLDKVVSGLDSHTEKFIALSPFAVYATENQQGHMDLSPRGGKPGFIQVLDEQTLLLPEYAGNDRIDTLKNLIDNPQIGLMLLVPGIGESLRIKGQATLYAPDENLTDFFAKFTPPPKVIIEVKIHTLYFQCAAALKRSKIWQNDNLIDRSAFPSIYQIIEDQFSVEKLRKNS